MINDGLICGKLGSATLVVDLIPTSNRTSRPQIKINPTFITIHNTGNSRADGRANSEYVDETTDYISWHFTADDKYIYQELPLNEMGYHAGTTEGNTRSIGIEICEHTSQDWDKAKANAVVLIKQLMSDLNIPIQNVVPHKHWSGKYCPHKILDEGWDKFISLIGPMPMIEDYKYEKIRFKNHTDVHIFKTKKLPRIVLGERWKQETLPEIVAQYKDVICATNCGMFAYDKITEHYGLLITDALYYQNSSPNFVDFIAWKDGTVSIEAVRNYNVDTQRLVNMQNNAEFGIGTSYALMIKGVPSKLNWNKFSHSAIRTNRTIIGYNGSQWYSIVADGGTTWDLGLTAEEQVELCQQLGITDACNLDGGGSSDMWLKDKIVTGNYVAERKIGTAIIFK